MSDIEICGICMKPLLDIRELLKAMLEDKQL